MFQDMNQDRVWWRFTDYKELSVLPRLGLDEDAHPLHHEYNSALNLLVGVALRESEVGFAETYAMLNCIFDVTFDREMGCHVSRTDWTPRDFDPQPRECARQILEGFTSDSTECFWKSSDGRVEHPSSWLAEYDNPVDQDILTLFGVNEVFYTLGRRYNRRFLRMWKSFDGDPANFRRKFERLMEEEQRLRYRFTSELQRSGVKRNYTTVAVA